MDFKCTECGCKFVRPYKGQSCSFCYHTNTLSYSRGTVKCSYCGEDYNCVYCDECGKLLILKKCEVGCFITAACCEALGLSDDCYELSSFRDFRDNWLRLQNGGESLIKEYYEIAPKIVTAINNSNNSKNVYLQIWEQYLKDCLSYIETKDFEKCKTLYVSMCEDLKNKYIQRM